ncbi:Glucose-repressible alcohol dehydrogenase transcriptional effector [Coemansia sp. Benny D115]|nr:Glucose-repressible alcohol dehydrogenase transcriptional effector [Coemansia sp. Benny D115]
MYMPQGQTPGQQLSHGRQGLGGTSQGEAAGHYISASMGGSNAHLVGMSGAMGPNELALNGMAGVMSSAMMVNGSAMMGSMGQAHTMYAGGDGSQGITAAQAAAAAAQAQAQAQAAAAAAAAQGVANPMMSSPSVLNGSVQMAPTPVMPNSQFHQQQMLVYQKSRASATPHYHARAAMALQRQQGNYLGSNTYDSSHVVVGTPVSNYADFLSGRSTTPLGHLNGQSSMPVIIRPPSTRAKSVSIGSANDRRTPGPGLYANGNGGASAVATPVQGQQAAAGAKGGSRWSELDLGGMNLRVISAPLFRYTFLTKLYINHNQLTHIPAAISQLRNLEELDASGNAISVIPPELGLCCRLKELLLFDNQITDLPFELGTLYQLESFGLEGNPLQEGLKALLQKEGARALIEYLRENAPSPAPPPERQWISLDKETKEPRPDPISVMSYNVLCPKYATPQMYNYCPAWVLSWENRRESIVSEILDYEPDIICLQEVEASQFDEFFKERLCDLGYEGVFWTKSRARTMSESERRLVDGCATFYKTDKFHLIASHLLEFQQSALSRKDFRKCDDFFNRFMTKDNIVGFAMLKYKRVESEPTIFVANAHVHWDPEFTDVKMVQTAMLTEELAMLARKYDGLPPASSAASLGDGSESHRIQMQQQQQQKQFQKVAVIICGDFNSKPDSGLYEFLSRGRLDKDHVDLERLEPYADYKRNGLRHPFGLKSAYAGIGELPLTNYTPTFNGTIDYIWYSVGTLVPTGVLGEIDEEWMSQCVGFPNANIPSDHIPILAEFKWRTASNPPNSSGTPGRQQFMYNRR